MISLSNLSISSGLAKQLRPLITFFSFSSSLERREVKNIIGISFVEKSFPFFSNTKIDVQKNNQNMQRFILKTLSDIPEQSLNIHIELANVPSYSNEVKILNFPPLNPAVRVEKLPEILADKITAIGNRDYLKGRDIWDVYFLIFEKQITVPWDLVKKKAKDYGLNPENLKDDLIVASKKIREKGVIILTNEMKRFLPKPIFDQYGDEFDEIVNKVATNIEIVKRIDIKKIKLKRDNSESR